jgi:hypothetical protein
MRTKKLGAVLITAVLVVSIGAVAVAATSGGGTWTSGYQMMRGGLYAYRPAHPTAVHTMAAARADAQHYASRLGLRVGEVLQFKQNFYAKLVDSKGNGATEVLVDPSTGTVSLEYGPAMMWNTKYGMMSSNAASMMGSYGASMMRGSGYGGMMGGSGNRSGAGSSGYGPGMMGGSGSGGMMGGDNGSTTTSPSTSTTTATVSMAAAHTLAQRWLSSHEPGVQVETGGDAFPGYYTLETLKGGRITGMISVNATSGAVWPHWWHGAFLAKWEA